MFRLGHRRQAVDDGAVDIVGATGGEELIPGHWELVAALVKPVLQQLDAVRKQRRVEGKPELTSEDLEQQAHGVIVAAAQETITEMAERGMPQPTVAQEQRLVTDVFASMFRGGRLQALLDDQQLEGIEINGCDEVFVRYPDGRRVPAAPVAETDEELIETVRRLATYHGLNPRHWDPTNWQLDVRLKDGARVSAVMGVSARPIVNIRRHRLVKVTLEDLVGNGTLAPELAEFLAAVVRARKNVVIGGKTGAGKTTLLRALINAIDPAERLVTIENALELGIRGLRDLHPNVVEFEARLPNVEGVGAVTMTDLVRRTLRMDADRVIVGEVLGREIVAMLQAMSQGNEGSLSTIHARYAWDVIDRMVMYAEQDPQLTERRIAKAVDFIVFLRRSSSQDRADGDGRRFVDRVLEVAHYDPATPQGVATNEIWQPGEDGVAARDLATQIICMPELRAVGYTDQEWRP
ncbi:MAG: ATP-binding cassette domain-containing protein [Pseudonocardiaceae bacterium]|nr:ATP-binding cassette domain-containing protein [Pseudonocardiaceae bacterium]